MMSQQQRHGWWAQWLISFSAGCPHIREALAGSHEALDVRGGEQSPAPLLGGAVHSQVHRGHPPMPS